MNVYFISIDKLDKQVLKNWKQNGIGNMMFFLVTVNIGLLLNRY